MKLGPRWVHALYARALGYFWLPCPVCRRPFGGHEWNAGHSWDCGPRNPGTAMGVCSPECYQIAREFERLGYYAPEGS